MIVRKNYGVIALKSAWSEKEIKQGKIDWFIGNLYQYESKMIKNGIYDLPADKYEK